MKRYRVWWSPQALDDLKAIYDYIYEQSPKGADKVFDTLLDLGDALATLPERFPIEEHAESKLYSFRFIPKWNYKIIYRINVNADIVVIARIISTRQNLENFKVE